MHPTAEERLTLRNITLSKRFSHAFCMLKEGIEINELNQELSHKTSKYII